MFSKTLTRTVRICQCSLCDYIGAGLVDHYHAKHPAGIPTGRVVRTEPVGTYTAIVVECRDCSRDIECATSAEAIELEKFGQNICSNCGQADADRTEWDVAP